MMSPAYSNLWATALIIIVLTVAGGCGYQSYKAFYVPEEVRAQGRDMIMSDRSHTFEEKLDGNDVTLGFWPIYVRDSSRECFGVDLLIGPDRDITTPLDSANGEFDTAPFPVAIDSIIIRSLSTGKQWNLLRTGSERIRGKQRIDFGRICLKRRHSRISVEFHAVTPQGNNGLPSSQAFAMKLIRWENRNWLGLE